MSTFAFGTYKITDENPLHIEALKEAIESGVRLIETGTHYTNGGAERAIAKVMAFFEDSVRNCIFHFILPPVSLPAFHFF